MKGIGNRHMANQEFTRAYNAYAAALKLSPVGPSSHVFLSNRAAALLSLRQYHSASVDAKRAIALAPAFAKAHARLGQALYFLRDYEGAIIAYENAVMHEPNNDVTKSYLAKAQEKLAKKARRYGAGEDGSIDSNHGANLSIATDPNGAAGVLGHNGAMLHSSPRVRAVVRSEFNRGADARRGRPLNTETEHSDEDPDFDEALKLQEKAAVDLAAKRYKMAVEQYSAALFLVPDDTFLSAQLHIGRAHALNGLLRHEQAINDSKMAVSIDPGSSEAYSSLAKSYFYDGEFVDAIDAFEQSRKLLTPGESISIFDQTFLAKAKENLEKELEEEKAAREAGEESPRSIEKKKKMRANGLIPKLRPPRFVSREQVVSSVPTVPSMPKQWPSQSPKSSSALKVGPERKVTYISESMGLRLNRGSTDGFVRVVSVRSSSPGTPIAREGHIMEGDILREVAGVDLRRPITSVMWSDTVALIKISPRPTVFIVARELSPPPPAFFDELAKASNVEKDTDRLNTTDATADISDDYEGAERSFSATAAEC